MHKLICFLLIFVVFSCEKGKSDNKTAEINTHVDNYNTIIYDYNFFNKDSEVLLKLFEPEDFTKLPLIDDKSYFNQVNFEGYDADYIESMYSKFMEIDFSQIEVSNCIITNDYSVPYIKLPEHCLGGGFSNDLVTKNEVTKLDLHNGIRVILRKDTAFNNDNITITLFGGTNEFIYPENIKFYKITDEYTGTDEYFGYYCDIFRFEHKPWLNNGNDENLWKVIVKNDENELVSGDISFEYINMLFIELNNSPFIIDDISSVDLNKKYTYRFKTDDTDILVIYYGNNEIFNGNIFKPVLFILPNRSEDNFNEIGISWNDVQLKGKYRIRGYKFYELPRGTWDTHLFGEVHVR